MRMRRTKLKAMIAIGLACAGVFAGCGGPGKPSNRPVETVRAKVITVRLETIPNEIEAPGTVQSATSAEIAARVMAPVVAVPVREGDVVKRGQLLIQLEERELAARQAAARSSVDEAAAAREQATRGLAAAEAEARVATRTFERYQFLQKEKSVSPQEFDEIEGKHAAAQAALAAARARQKQAEAAGARAESDSRAAEAVAGYARITAPFDGVVVRRSVDPGAMASPGMPLLVVEQVSAYRMEATLPAGFEAPRRGQAARVALDTLPGRSFPATVAEVEAGADPSSQTVRVRLDLPRDAALRSGLFGRAWFARGERAALLVPREVVVERGQLHSMYVLDAEKIARLRLVTLGATLGERVEVLSGLQEGDRIAVPGAGAILEGRRVEAQP